MHFIFILFVYFASEMFAIFYNKSHVFSCGGPNVGKSNGCFRLHEHKYCDQLG